MVADRSPEGLDLALYRSDDFAILRRIVLRGLEAIAEFPHSVKLSAQIGRFEIHHSPNSLPQ
jgi:hypothetical protein